MIYLHFSKWSCRYIDGLKLTSTCYSQWIFERLDILRYRALSPSPSLCQDAISDFDPANYGCFWGVKAGATSNGYGCFCSCYLEHGWTVQLMVLSVSTFQFISFLWWYKFSVVLLLMARIHSHWLLLSAIENEIFSFEILNRMKFVTSNIPSKMLYVQQMSKWVHGLVCLSVCQRGSSSNNNNNSTSWSNNTDTNNWSWRGKNWVILVWSSHQISNPRFIIRKTLSLSLRIHWPAMILLPLLLFFISSFSFAIHFRSMNFMKINKLLGWITFRRRRFHSSIYYTPYSTRELLLSNIGFTWFLQILLICFLKAENDFNDRHTRFIRVQYGNNRIECRTPKKYTRSRVHTAFHLYHKHLS